MERERLVLLSIRQEMAAMYMRELESVFEGLLDMTCCSIEQDTDATALRELVSRADIVLVTSANLFEYARPFLRESCRVVMLQYGFVKERINYLKSFPPNTSALVCFHFHHISAQIVTMLYEHGLDNLDLKAYKEGEPVGEGHYELAIVGSDSAVVPEGVGQVVSLGRRKLALSTLLAIASSADILSGELEAKFQEYCSVIYTENPSFFRFYDIFSVNKLQMKTIMDRIDYAILICDGDYRILDFNDNVKSMFAIKRNISRMHLSEVPEFGAIAPLLMAEVPPQDLLAELSQNRNVLLTREDTPSLMRTENYHIVLIKDVTKLLSLEQTLKKQLSQKGHVAKYDFSSIQGRSAALRECVDRARKIARLDKPTLIIGESGTGKELFAHSIHSASARRDFPFLALNCAALPSSLLESELFGYSDGAFTGAKKGGHVGLFEQANKGTFFLDEIGEISLETQTKLLRVLEEQEIMRVGSGEIVPIDVRVIAATNQNLRELVREGKFRMDLYYRLNTLELNIPPVRERREDIPILVQHVLDSENLSHIKVSREAMDFFLNFGWEGNVRELRNCIEYMANVSDGTITLADLPNYILEEYADHWRPELGTPAPARDLSVRDRTLAVGVLELLTARPLGRGALLRALEERGTPVSDYHLRQIVEGLREENLIRVGRGRRGMEITRLGLAALRDERIKTP